MTKTKHLPVIALTMGDIAGIGPEIVLRAVTHPQVHEICSPVVVGHPQILKRVAAQMGMNVVIEEIASPENHPVEIACCDQVFCWNPSEENLLDVPLGSIDKRAGRAAYDYLVSATEAALRGHIDGITTAPLNKLALHQAGLNFPGHTEILAKECHCDQFAMMLYLPPDETIQPPYGLGVAHVTLHTSIQSVPQLLSTENIFQTGKLLANFMQQVGCDQPRIAICAVNPHAGEAGLFGDEEEKLIAPAVKKLSANGIDVTGPLPADTLILRAVRGQFDGIVAMYHDQGHIPFKLLGFHKAVNITLGLPIVRTSPSHGTAFDIADKYQADATGMIEAIRVAVMLTK